MVNAGLAKSTKQKVHRLIIFCGKASIYFVFSTILSTKPNHRSQFQMQCKSSE